MHGPCYPNTLQVSALAHNACAHILILLWPESIHNMMLCLPFLVFVRPLDASADFPSHPEGKWSKNIFLPDDSQWKEHIMGVPLLVVDPESFPS